MKHWQLQEAKAKLSQLVRNVMKESACAITIHGKPEVVVISKQEYDRLTKPRESFYELIRKSPFVGVELDLTRDKSVDREVDL